MNTQVTTAPAPAPAEAVVAAAAAPADAVAPSNPESVAKVAAHAFDREFGKLLKSYADSADAVVAAIVKADTPGTIAGAPDQTVWEVLEYRSLKMWVQEQLNDGLKNWDESGRMAIARVLLTRCAGLDLTTVAKMTGVSKATMTRTMQKAREADGGKPAAPKEPSTPQSRLTKSLESLIGSVADADKWPTADLKRLHADLLRAAATVSDQLQHRPASGLKSGSEGTTANGVAKPAAPKPAK